MRPQMTDTAIRQMEERFKLQHEAEELLGLIAAEFNSDPQSVQCFDLRTVERHEGVAMTTQPKLPKWACHEGAKP